MELMLLILMLVALEILRRKGAAIREGRDIEKFNAKNRPVYEHPEPSPELQAQLEYNAEEAKNRRLLEKQGYTDDLIAIILPQVMGDK
jgi:hypothetical protein